MIMEIMINEKETLSIDDVKKAFEAFPNCGGVWKVDNPQGVVAALEVIVSKTQLAAAATARRGK